MGDLDASMKYDEEGLLVEPAVLDKDHAHIMVTLTNIAQIYKQHGSCVSEP
jgi:hypothetical protein